MVSEGSRGTIFFDAISGWFVRSMYGWTGGWVGGWLGGWVRIWMGKCMDG